MSSRTDDITVPGPPRCEEVSDGIHAYVQPDGTWWINNTGFVVGPQGVIAVDACSTERRTRAFLDTIASVTDRPVRTLVNTHHHGDHTFGNALFGGATILAHERTRAEAIAFGPARELPYWHNPEWGDLPLDPPFVTGSDFDFLAAIPGAPEGAPRIAVPAYRDAAGLDAWLTHFDSVARLLRELLADGGSLYVHLDAHVAHYAKVLLDEVFGAGAFQREIIWRIGWVSGFKSRARNWVRNHDAILFYAKGGRGFTFHKEYIPYPEGYVRRDGVVHERRVAALLDELRHL